MAEVKKPEPKRPAPPLSNAGVKVTRVRAFSITYSSGVERRTIRVAAEDKEQATEILKSWLSISGGPANAVVVDTSDEGHILVARTYDSQEPAPPSKE